MDSSMRSSIVREWLSSLAELIFPTSCACCSVPLQEGEHTLCLTCRMDMPMTGYYNRQENYVVELFAGRVAFDNASALMFFRQRTGYQKMIHRMKYSGRDDIAYVLGQVYGGVLAKSPLYAKIDTVVPVPLHWTKLMKRGYNQSEEFARGVAESMGVAYESRALRRVKRTRTQARMSSDTARAQNVKDAFRLISPHRLVGKNVLLLDDVITTGSTLESCADTINRELPDVRLSLGALAVVDRI